MYANENFRKIVKIFIFTLMCCLLDSSFTQQNASQNRSAYYSTASNSSQMSSANAKFLASIRLKALDKIFGDGHICSGALIAPSVVLTVGQCVHNYNDEHARHPSEIKVVMGSINRYEHSPETLVLSVTHIYKPKTFDPQTLNDNLAILMLEKDVPFGHPTVQPIALSGALKSKSKAEIFEYISWGRTKEGLPVNEAFLLNSTQTDNKVCLSALQPLFGSTGVMCLNSASTEPNLCPSDAGAPLVLDNKLVGLASVGQGCASELMSVIFTEVAHYSPWIYSEIGDGSNQNGSLWGTLGLMLFTFYTVKSSKILKAL